MLTKLEAMEQRLRSRGMEKEIEVLQNLIKERDELRIVLGIVYEYWLHDYQASESVHIHDQVQRLLKEKD